MHFTIKGHKIAALSNHSYDRSSTWGNSSEAVRTPANQNSKLKVGWNIQVLNVTVISSTVTSQGLILFSFNIKNNINESPVTAGVTKPMKTPFSNAHRPNFKKYILPYYTCPDTSITIMQVRATFSWTKTNETKSKHK